MDFESEMQTISVTTIFTSTITFTKTEYMAVTMPTTVTISDCSTSATSGNQASCMAETDTITNLHHIATTGTVSHTPNSGMVDQGSRSNGSQTVWMVVAILFIMIALSTTVFNIFLGYILLKKINTLKNSSTATSATRIMELVTEGTFKFSYKKWANRLMSIMVHDFNLCVKL